jgi:hypothetical protein
MSKCDDCHIELKVPFGDIIKALFTHAKKIGWLCNICQLKRRMYLEGNDTGLPLLVQTLDGFFQLIETLYGSDHFPVMRYLALTFMIMGPGTTILEKRELPDSVLQEQVTRFFINKENLAGLTTERNYYECYRGEKDYGFFYKRV